MTSLSNIQKNSKPFDFELFCGERGKSQPALDDEVFSAKLAKFLHQQITNDIQALERRIQALETNTVLTEE